MCKFEVPQSMVWRCEPPRADIPLAVYKCHILQLHRWEGGFRKLKLFVANGLHQPSSHDSLKCDPFTPRCLDSLPVIQALQRHGPQVGVRSTAWHNIVQTMLAWGAVLVVVVKLEPCLNRT